MAEARDWFAKWSSSVASVLCCALVLGGLNLHSDVKTMAKDLAANIVLTQTTDRRANLAETQAASVRTEIEGLRRDIDDVKAAVDAQAKEAAEGRAQILQELGRLQGRNDSPSRSSR